MSDDVLSDRALGRATLARQLLLDRAPRAPLAAVADLVGLQAQNPLDPYLALWSRLDRFDPTTVGRLLEERSLVRIVVMRGTIHLVTADDALQLRPLTQPVLDAELARHAEFAPLLAGVDVGPVLDLARRRLADTPLTGPELRAAIAAGFPTLPAAALAYACRCLLPLVQVPPRGVWGKTLPVTTTPLDAWVGRPLAAAPAIDEVVRRYLGAFGPASAADAAAWSRLTGMREVVERLRPGLRTFRTERGAELFDLPDAPRPDPDTPAPVRVLPEYDNVLLSHADRSRFGGDEDRRFRGAAGPIRGTVLADGMVRAVWHVEGQAAKRAVAVVEHLPLPRRTADAVAAEALRAIRFWRPDASDHDVRLTPIG